MGLSGLLANEGTRLFENRRRFNVCALLLVLLAGIFFAPVVKGYWLADDFYWVRDFWGYDWREIPKLFLGDWSRAAAQEYRPLWALSFLLDLKVWGPEAQGLHLTNILFHLIVSALVWYLVKAIDGDKGLAALLSLAFFVLAPIHAEPVAWISARGHILAPIFILSSIILLGRFHKQGGMGTYFAILAAITAAFATQEAAAALPILLLLRDVSYAPRWDRRWFNRTLLIHAPFWALLGIYLLFRMWMFGRLGRDEMPSTLPQLLYQIYISVRILWLSPYTLPDLPRLFAGAGMKWLLFLSISIYLLAPFAYLRDQKLRDYTRGLFYFAIAWPVITTAVYFGASAERHLYLGSIGPCIALGFAGGELLTAKRPYFLVGSVTAALLFLLYGSALASGIAGYTFNGQRSLQIKQEIDGAIERAARDQDAVVVILPEIPDNDRVLWDYFYPAALQPPFDDPNPAVRVIGSFASCHCQPEEWRSYFGAAIIRIMDGKSGPIYVVEWDARQAAFVTHRFNPIAFREGGYTALNGPILRARRPGDQSAALP